jgi:hypothetical protein
MQFPFNLSFIPNPKFYLESGSPVPESLSTKRSKPGDFALIRFSYLSFTRGHPVRLIERRTSGDWLVQYLVYTDGHWTGPDGLTRHSANQTPIFNDTSLQRVSFIRAYFALIFQAPLNLC